MPNQSESGSSIKFVRTVHPTLRHPITGEPVVSEFTFRGCPVWTPMGGAPDDDKGGDAKGDDGKSDDDGKTDDGKSDDGKSSDDDKVDWKARYEGRQEVVQNLERELNKLKDGLKGVLGVEDKTTKPEELVAGLQQQIAEMKHETSVSNVARRHGITDDDDIDFLRTAKDEEAMTKLAARLKPSGDGKDDDSARGRGRGPKPDKSQGSSSSDGSGARPTSVEAVREERRRKREDAGKK